MWFRIKKFVGWSLFVLLSFSTLFFGSWAAGEYFDRFYISDFEFFGALWLACTIVLIFIALCVGRKAKKWSKIAIYFLILGPEVLLGIGIISDVIYYRNASEFETKVSWEGRMIELAPPGPGFPVVPIDFPGNHLIPWMGWANKASWDEANNACSHLSIDGKKLIDSQQDAWRLPTMKEAMKLAILFRNKNTKILSPHFSIWWTATTGKYEHCAPSKNGQCHIIFSLATETSVETNYVPYFQAYRCIRDLK